MSINEEAGITPAAETENIAAPEIENPEQVKQGGGGLSFSLPEWVWIEGSAEPLDPTYTEHPLNFKKSAGLAQIIRGFSALFGSVLNYWWMDVVMGFMRMRTEGREAE